jgi:hypothetical protein
MNHPIEICTNEDPFVYALQDEKRTAVWVADLSDGTIVYMDDGRPGLERSAWLRLCKHCRQKGLWVKRLHVKFRSNRADPLPLDAQGYYFSHMALGGFGFTDTLQFYLIGALTNQKVRLYKIQVPELIIAECEDRSLGEIYQEALISRPAPS